MKKRILALLLMVAILLAIWVVFWYFPYGIQDSYSHEANELPTIKWRGEEVSLSSIHVPNVGEALRQLKTDLQDIKPHFIPNVVGGSFSKTSYTKIEQRIQNDLIMFYAAWYKQKYPGSSRWFTTAYNGIRLNAIGENYLLVTKAQKSAIDEVLNIQTGEITPLTHSYTKRIYLAPKRPVAVYIDKQKIYTYHLGQTTTTTLVLGSKLSGTKTYDSGFHDGPGPFIVNPVVTHTTSTITISIFDSRKKVPHPDYPHLQRYKKVGERTLTF